MVLIFSKHVNASEQVMNEVECAVGNRKPIFPLRLDNATPSQVLEYFISRRHWLDASAETVDTTAAQLADAIRPPSATVAQIFLCHANEDKAHVRDLYQRLKATEGLEPWLDEEDLLPGQDWAREIRIALRASDFILIVLSRNSVAKQDYVQSEMKMALDILQELPEGTIHTIPVRLDDCDVPEQFRRYHCANLFDPRGFERLILAIQTGLTQRTSPDEQAVQDRRSGA